MKALGKLFRGARRRLGGNMKSCSGYACHFPLLALKAPFAVAFLFICDKIEQWRNPENKNRAKRTKELKRTERSR